MAGLGRPRFHAWDYPCPGGCGKRNDSGNWCGHCSWPVASEDTELGRTVRDIHRVESEPWPFGWTQPGQGIAWGVIDIQALIGAL